MTLWLRRIFQPRMVLLKAIIAKYPEPISTADLWRDTGFNLARMHGLLMDMEIRDQTVRSEMADSQKPERSGRLEKFISLTGLGMEKVAAVDWWT